MISKSRSEMFHISFAVPVRMQWRFWLSLICFVENKNHVIHVSLALRKCYDMPSWTPPSFQVASFHKRCCYRIRFHSSTVCSAQIRFVPTNWLDVFSKHNCSCLGSNTCKTLNVDIEKLRRRGKQLILPSAPMIKSAFISSPPSSFTEGAI